MLRGLRWQLFFTYLLVGFLPVGVYAVTVSYSLGTYLFERRATELRSFASQLSVGIPAGAMASETQRSLIAFEIDSQNAAGNRVLVVDASGTVVVDTNNVDIGNTLAFPEILEALEGADVSGFDQAAAIVNVAVSVFESGEIVGAVFVSASAPDIVETIDDVNQQLIWMALPFGCFIALFVFIIARLFIEPLRKILNVVQKVSDGHMDQRIEVQGHSEFAELSVAFNEMTTKLEQVEMTRNEFVSNVSHELKTPLSAMKVLSEALVFQEDVPAEMYREFLIDINSEIDRMAVIVEELLALVKLDRTENPLKIAPMRVNKMVEDILKRLYPLAEQKEIELLYEDAKQVSIDADEMKLSLAVSNLVENGIKYTNSGGVVKVTVNADHQNVFITVQDTGVGIDDEDQKKVFTRFYRVDKVRNRETGGTGLGLSITQKTVLLHKGSIKLTSKPDEGSTFVVRLPLHQEPPPEHPTV